MTEVWIVLIEDRHGDADPLPYDSREDAEAMARDWASGPDSFEGRLTSAQEENGVVLWIGWGTEGDCVSVLRRELNKGR